MMEIAKGIFLAYFLILLTCGLGYIVGNLGIKLLDILSRKPKLKTFLAYSAYNRDFTVFYATCVENILMTFDDILMCSDDWIIYECEDINNVDTYRIAAARDNRIGVEVTNTERS